MGSYSDLYFDNIPIAFSKDIIAEDILVLFQENELVIDNNEDSYFAGFITNLGNIVDRIKIIWDDYENASFYLQETIFEEIKSLKEVSEYLDGDKKNDINIEINLLEKYWWSDFFESARRIIESRKNNLIVNHPIDVFLCNKEVNIFDYKIFRYGGLNSFLYLAGKVFDHNTEIKYDVTSLCHQEPDFFEFSAFELMESVQMYKNAQLQFGEKILILTEGNSDKEILSQSLKLLYPHIYEYYFFMDFGSANVSGSASSLVTTIKSFIGGGIKSKVIALFDNDTAAYEAKTALERVHIPENIKLIHLPELDYAENYPTLGPTGLVNMNINGLACGIEMYLGEELLIENEQFLPIQWKGYSEKIGKYQGVVSKKNQIGEKFKIKLKECENDKSKINHYDWDGIKSIFELIFQVFKKERW